jgi:hypothetical protein
MNLLAAANTAGMDVLAVLDPGEGVAPPGSEGLVTIVNWVAWVAVARHAVRRPPRRGRRAGRQAGLGARRLHRHRRRLRPRRRGRLSPHQLSTPQLGAAAPHALRIPWRTP